MELIIDRVLSQLSKLAVNQNTTIDKIQANYIDVMDTTGPGVFAESIYHGLSLISDSNITSPDLTGITEPRLIGDVLIMLITSFGAGLAYSNAGSVTDESALVQYTFAGSWKADHPMGGIAMPQSSKSADASSEEAADNVPEDGREDGGLHKKGIKEEHEYKVKRRRLALRQNPK